MSSKASDEVMDLSRFDGHTPEPWSIEPMKSDDGYNDFCVMDAEGRSLFDSLNADYRVKCIHTEYNEDGANQWDEPSRVNLTLAAAAPELLAHVRTLSADNARLREQDAKSQEVIRTYVALNDQLVADNEKWAKRIDSLRGECEELRKALVRGEQAAVLLARMYTAYEDAMDRPVYEGPTDEEGGEEVDRFFCGYALHLTNELDSDIVDSFNAATRPAASDEGEK
jgi:hypothetical protein